MYKKWIIGVAVCVALTAGWLTLSKNEAAPSDYIIGPEVVVSLQDVTSVVKKGVRPEMSLQVPATEFIDTSEEGIVTVRTLVLFRQLQVLFNDSVDMEDHFLKVFTWLKAWYPEALAERIFAVYRDYTLCEKDLAVVYQGWGNPNTPEGVLDMLRAVQDFRRERLGVETADLLYGADVKSREYRVRKGSVIQDGGLYGAEKEARIARLNEEMWGDAVLSPDLMKNSYNRYQEKVSLYARDLSELETEGEKAELVHAFRQGFFSAEVVEKLEEVDAQIKAEKGNEAAYFQAEEGILQSSELGPDEKSEALKALQSQYFGKEAEAFRRRETKRKALEALAG